MSKCFRMRIAFLWLICLAFSVWAWSETQTHFAQVIDPYPTTMHLAATPSSGTVGATVSLTAELPILGSGGPTGTIIFTVTSASGEEVQSPPELISSGSATWSTVPSVGTNSVVAAYSGDSNYAAASAATQVVISPAPGVPDFDFSLPAITMKQGQSISGYVAMKPVNGFTGKVNFTCGTLLKQMTCSFPTASVDVASGMGQAALSTTAEFSIGTVGATVTTVAGSLLLIGFCGFRRKRRSALPWLLLGSSLLLLAGCGASDRFIQSDGTPVGTYSIPITGTSGNLSHTHNLTVIVTH